MKNNLVLHTWFPTTIGKAVCPFYSEIKKKTLQYIIKYKGKNGKYPDHVYEKHFKTKELKKLNLWINEQVSIYAKAHNFKKLSPYEGWFNVYGVNQCQNYHTHFGAIIATNFFIDAGPNDIGTIFRNPNLEPMNPWEFNTTEMNDAKNFNSLTYQTTNYEAKPGTLLIFRGHLHHGTNIKVTPHQRITLNYNYK